MHVMNDKDISYYCSAVLVHGGVIRVQLTRAGDGSLGGGVAREGANGNGDIVREDFGFKLGRQREDGGSPCVVLERGLVELGHRFKDHTIFFDEFSE